MQKTLILLSLAGALLSGCADPQAERAKRKQEEQIRLENIARTDLEKWTKDPLAMQFRHVRQIPRGICGEVNMKDDLGRYRGFMHFLDRANFRGDPGFNPSIANPDSVFALRGTDEVLQMCMDEVQRAEFRQQYDAAAAAWKRKMDYEYEEAQIKLLEEELRQQQLLKQSRR